MYLNYTTVYIFRLGKLYFELLASVVKFEGFFYNMVLARIQFLQINGF